MSEIKFKWEEVVAFGECSTQRAKVFGGWIVRTVSWTKRWGNDQVQSLAESSVFIPDANHEWKIKETPCLK